MRRAGKPDGDDRPMLEIELVGGEPDEAGGGDAEREPLWHRLRRAAGLVRRSIHRISLVAVTVATAAAIGAIAMRMWDDRADERVKENTVAASITLEQGGAAPALEPTSGTARGSIEVVVHNAGPVLFSLIGVGTDLANVRIATARVVGDALVPPGGNGQFDVSFDTDCSKVRPSGPNPDYVTAEPVRMTLRVRTAAQQLRTVLVQAPQPDLKLQESWAAAQQLACGANAPPPMILTWPDTAPGFPEATVHGNTATIPVTAILQRSRPATLRSIDGMPGVGIETPGLPLTLQPRAPIAEISVTVVVTDCASAAELPQPPFLDAHVEDSGSSWSTSGDGVVADGRLALAIVGAISRICGH
jgi:hypothetical protein